MRGIDSATGTVACRITDGPKSRGVEDPGSRTRKAVLAALLVSVVWLVPSAAEAQESAQYRTSRLALVVSMRGTIDEYDGKLYFGENARGYGLRLQGPAWRGIRAWASAAFFDLGILCIDPGPCDTDGWAYGGGLMLDYGALRPSSLLQPYAAIGAGHSSRRSRSWYLSPSAGLAVRIGRVAALRGGLAWGERLLRDRQFVLDLGVQIDLLRR